MNDEIREQVLGMVAGMRGEKRKEYMRARNVMLPMAAVPLVASAT